MSKVPGGEYFVNYRSKSDVFRLWCLGDFHYGSRACAEHLLRRHIKVIEQDKHALWLGMGDYAEFIGYTDKRFDPDAVAEHIKVKDLKTLGKNLMASVADMLAPIADKCIGILAGNHEKRYEADKEQGELTEELAEQLKAPYHGYCTHKYLVFRHRPTEKGGTSNSFLIFCHHGSGYAATPGGKLNKLIVAWQVSPFSHFTLLAHCHEPMAYPIVCLKPDPHAQRVGHHRTLGVITGSYLKTYDDFVDIYATQKLYRPVDLGAKVITIKPYPRLSNTIIGDMI